MAFQRLKITPEDGSPFDVLYNPEKYTLNKGVQFAEIGIPGLDSPVLQFVRGQNEKVTLELFYDTTDGGTVGDVTDVRTETVKVYDLMKILPDTHAPPRCQLEWGTGGQLFSYGSSLNPRCVVESVSEEFSLFSPDGVPLRAKLNVTFREYKTVEEQVAESPRHSSDRTKVRVVARGDTLALISWLEYGDATQWRRIADANALANPRLLTPGASLLIPSAVPGSP